MTAACGALGCERPETWVCRECLVEAMDPSVDELAAEYGRDSE